jgi:hypothetical protein
MEFVCVDREAVVRAANVRATLDAFQLVPAMGERLIARYNLDIKELTEDKFVPVQSWLDALKEIQERLGAPAVRRVGARIIENADFPPHLGSVEAILDGLDAIYHLNHRGEVGHYLTSRRGSAIVVGCETPYPSAFEIGLIEGICNNRKLGTRKYLISSQSGTPNALRTVTVTVRPQ